MHCDILNVARRRARRIGARGLLIAGFAAALARLQHHDGTGHHRRHSRRLPRAPSDRVEGRQEDAGAVRRRRPRRPFADAARRSPRLCAELEARRHRRRHRRRPVGGANDRAANDTLEGSAVDHRAGRRAQQRHRHPALQCRPSRIATLRLNYPLLIGGRRPLRTVARRSRAELRAQDTSRTGSTTTSAAPRSAIWRRWSPSRPTLCSRAPRAPPTPPSAPSAIEKWRKGESPATHLSRCQQGRDQRCGQMIRTALQTVSA